MKQEEFHAHAHKHIATVPSELLFKIVNIFLNHSLNI